MRRIAFEKKHDLPQVKTGIENEDDGGVTIILPLKLTGRHSTATEKINISKSVPNILKYFYKIM